MGDISKKADKGPEVTATENQKNQVAPGPAVKPEVPKMDHKKYLGALGTEQAMRDGYVATRTSKAGKPIKAS